MPPLQSLTSRTLRPSIHEIAASILTPSSKQVCAARAQLQRGLHKSSRAENTVFTNSRAYHATSLARSSHSSPPTSKDRGPPSSETTQTDFASLDVLGGTPVPSTAIDACLWDGFHLNNGMKIRNGAGVLLVGGEAFGWRPWDAGQVSPGKNLSLLNKKGQWEVDDEAWGILGLVWPKPDLLILGLGPGMAPLSPKTKGFLGGLGIRVDVQDTRNASAQFNLLATERGVGSVAAALIPIGWREGVGVKSSRPYGL